MSLGLIQLAVVGTVSGLQNNQAANTAFAAIATMFSGGSAPTAGNTGLASIAGLTWRDTSVTPNQTKLRDDADTVWMPQWMVDQTGKVAAPYHSGTNPQTGTTYTVLATDLGKLVTFTNAGAIAITLPQATTAGLGKGFWFLARCLPGSTGSATITPTTSTIDGAANIVLRPGLTAIIVSDGANYFTAGYLNYSNLRIDGPIGINTTPFSATRLAVGGSISAMSADVNFAAGGNRALIDLSGAKARVGGINGGGSNVDLDLYARNSAVATFATGLAMAGATGGDMGAGTGNFTGLYVNGAALTGKLVQRVYAETGAVATGSTAMPGDDTIPQNTEGDQYLSVAITPTSATNRLRIRVIVWGSQSQQNHLVSGLFQDSVANALAACLRYNVVNARIHAPMEYSWEMVAGTTSATTFKVRVGASGAATTTINGESGARLLGGVFFSTIIIEEIVP